MTIRIKRSRHTNVRKTNSFIHVVFALFSIITVTSLMSCTSPTNGTDPVDPIATQESTGTAIAPISTQTPTSVPLTFITDADAQVDESNPNENYGNTETFRVDSESNSDFESFIRFTVTGVPGSVQGARLRLYATTNTKNGPTVYSTGASWMETEITWNTRPARTSAVVDNKDSIGPETWVEYNVTSLVTGNGTFSFVLVADSGDGMVFSSLQGEHPPELIVTLGSASPSTPTPTLPADAEVFVGAGDISLCSGEGDELTAQLLDAIPGTVFTVGDNAYDDGTYSQYIDCYDPTWGRHKARTKPIPGNHEYHTSDAAGYFRYFNNIPSYYAYNLGSWRIYALNSEIDVSAESPQVTWLQEDLAANPSQCVLAYWHQPRWSSGATHGSDREYQTLWRIFYKAGAEVVLNGHEHNYERFAPMNATGEADPLGLREFVVGTGGKSHYEFGRALPNSEVRNDTTYGVLKLTLRATGYDWEFVPVAGSTFTDSGSTDCH